MWRGWTPEDVARLQGKVRTHRLEGEDVKQQAKPKRSHKGKAAIFEPEAVVLKRVLAAVQNHPSVVWAARINSGVAMLPGKGGKPQPVRFGFPGCSDIIGQTKAGLFLAVECKSETGRATKDQEAFLERVRAAGGVAVLAKGARALEDVLEALATCERRP